MVVTDSDVVKLRVTKKAEERASFLAEKKLGFRYEKDGTLVKTGKDTVYNRYNYPRKDRWKKVYIGELAEEASKAFMDTLGLEYVCYNDVREDDYKKDDPFDFKIGKLRIDLKTSRDNREHGLAQILKEQHLVTPIDQSVKDVVMQAFLRHDEKVLWLCAWATGKQLMQEKNLGYLHWQPGKYYLLKVKDCNPMSELASYLKSMT
jgi:hypothetical protein